MTESMQVSLSKLLAPLHIVAVTEPARLGGGSSQENWAFDAEFADQSGPVSRQLLLRREPVRGVIDTSRDVEFELLKALNGTDLPVPRVYVSDDGTLMGRPAMVVDRVSGHADRAVLRDKDPLGLGAEARLALARALPELLSRVHLVDIAASGIMDILPGPSSDPALDELDRWTRELGRVELEPHPALRAVIAWLHDNRPPPPDTCSLVHGDFRPANLLVDKSTVVALLDWELARLGDPHDDLGWYTNSLYRREHFIAGRWEVDDFLSSWERSTNFAVDRHRLHFWQVMSVFRLAVIALSGVRAFCDGETDRPAAPADRVIRAALSETGLLDRTASAKRSAT